MKYSSTDRPSRKEDLMGLGIISPRGLDTRPFMPAIWRICWELPRAPESTIMSRGLKRLEGSVRSMIRPPAELGLGLLGLPRVAGQDGLLLRGGDDVVDGHREAGLGRVLEAQLLDAVEAGRHHRLGVVGRYLLHDDAYGRVAPADDVVHVAEADGQGTVEEQPPRSGLERLGSGPVGTGPGRALRLLTGGREVRPSLGPGAVTAVGGLGLRPVGGEVEGTGDGDRAVPPSRCRAELDLGVQLHVSGLEGLLH